MCTSIAEIMLAESKADIDVSDAFAVLKATSQAVHPTVVSLVYGATEHIAFSARACRKDRLWCTSDRKRSCILESGLAEIYSCI